MCVCVCFDRGKNPLWKETSIPTREEWMEKATELVKMVKLIVLIKEKNLPNFVPLGIGFWTLSLQEKNFDL